VILQIAKGGCIAFAAGEEMLVNAENQPTARRMPLGELSSESVLEIALHSSRSDALSPAQPAAGNAIQMQFIDGLLKSSPAGKARCQAADPGTAARISGTATCELQCPGTRLVCPSLHAERFCGTTPCCAARPRHNADIPSPPYTATRSAPLLRIFFFPVI